MYQMVVAGETEEILSLVKSLLLFSSCSPIFHHHLLLPEPYSSWQGHLEMQFARTPTWLLSEVLLGFNSSKCCDIHLYLCSEWDIFPSQSFKTNLLASLYVMLSVSYNRFFVFRNTYSVLLVSLSPPVPITQCFFNFSNSLVLCIFKIWVRKSLTFVLFQNQHSYQQNIFIPYTLLTL